MNKRKVRQRVIYFGWLAIVAAVVLILSNGTNYEKDGDAVYYYFPASYRSGWYDFRSMRTKARDGARIIYTGGLIYDTEAMGYTGTVSNIAVCAPKSRSEAAKNLYGGYYDDGRLAAVAYVSPNSGDIRELTGKASVMNYLKMVFYDRDGERAADIAEVCGEAYAADIAGSMAVLYPGAAVSRIFIECCHDDGGGCYIAAYFSAEPTEFDKEACERVPLLSSDGVDCGNYLRAVIFSDGGNEDNMRIAAEKAAAVLSGEYGDKINKTGDFTACAV